MIRFYDERKLLSGFRKLVAKIDAPQPIQIKADDVFMITTISEPPEHVAKIHEWLEEHAPNYLKYRGSVISLAIIPRDVASLLKLSIPL